MAAREESAAQRQAVARLTALIGRGAQGAALARALAREGARTRADLLEPAVLARLPRESRANVLFRPRRRVPLATADAVAAEVARRLVFVGGGGRPRRAAVTVVGSVRRRAPRAKDLDFLLAVPPGLRRGPEARARALASVALRPARAGDRLAIVDTYAAGGRRRSLVLRRGAGPRAPCFRADLFLATPAEWPFALFHFTGPSGYNIRTRALAKKRGLLLNQYGLFVAGSGRPAPGAAAVRTERDLARLLRVTYRAPEARAA